MTHEAAHADGTEPGPSSLHRELNRAWKTTVQLGFSLACTWSVAVLVRFAVPRHLGPAHFGDLSFAETFTAGFFVLANLGVDTYTMRETVSRPRHVTDYFAGVQLVRLAISAVLMISLLFVLLARDKSPALLLAAEVWALTHAMTTLNGTLGTLLQATGSTERLAIANVIAKITWGIGLVLALWYGDANTLFLFVVPALASEILRAWLIYPVARHAVDLRWRIDARATRDVLAASLPYNLGAIAIALGAPLNFMALELLNTDPHELGWYGATLSLATLALIFSPALQWVQMPLLARARRRSSAEVNLILSYSLEALLLVSIPLALVGALGAEFVVRIALGSAYAPAAPAFQVLVVMIVFTCVAMILANGLITHGKGWSLSTLSVANMLAAPALSLVLVPLGRRSLGTGGEAAGAAAALAITEVLVVALALARIGSGLITARLARAIVKSLFACGLVAALHAALPQYGDLRLVLDLLVYALLALLLRAIDLRELGQLIRDVRRA